MTLLDALAEELHKAGRYNHNDQVAPAAVLWTDGARHFEKLAPMLRGRLALLTLGEYAPRALSGPAIWLRCAIAGTLEDVSLPGGVPIIYLPGVEKAQLRAVRECPEELKPLAELQYRGTLFAHENGKDWTPAALLSQQGVKVATDEATRKALARTLPRVATEQLEALRKHLMLTAGIIYDLANPDPVGTLLEWLSTPEAVKERLEQEGNWRTFTEQCKAEYRFHPDKDGALSAARLLGTQQGKWVAVWKRFTEAPQRYTGLKVQLRQARPGGMLTPTPESWPQDNEAQEKQLGAALSGLATLQPAEARERVLELEAVHGKRRTWVWATLGKAPLAVALAKLAEVARQTAKPLGHGLPAELAERYFSEHWKTDAAALEALAAVSAKAEVEAVQAALTATYRPWLEEAAKAFQDAVAAEPLPAPATPLPKVGACLLFADGLRLDIAQRLAEKLEAQGCALERGWAFGALPGVTATAKPAISPLAERMTPDVDFSVRFQGSRVTASVLRKALTDAGLSVFGEGEAGDPTKGGWTEYGDLDSTGHSQGLKLARHADGLGSELADRVLELLRAGWREVKLITDHGWLLLGSGLSKTELPQHLTELRKGRCARLKQGSIVNIQSVPWRYDAGVSVATAPGISAFEAGKVYEHGGLSVQECVLPVFTVRAGETAARHMAGRIVAARWKGLRCELEAEGISGSEQVALRLSPNDTGTTVAGPKPVGQSLPVPDDSLEGQAVFAVLLSADGRVLDQRETRVGGD